MHICLLRRVESAGSRREWTPCRAGNTDGHNQGLRRDPLRQIAGEKGGTLFVLDVAPPFETNTSVQSTAAAPVELASKLPSRLADTYVAARQSIPIYGTLSDDAPITGASVEALIAGPETMTDDGRELLVNVTHALR